MQELRAYLLTEIDIQYGSISGCPNDDIKFITLQRLYGVEPRISIYDKGKIEQMRVERGLSGSELSIALGYNRSWYNYFKGSAFFHNGYAKMLADYFGVDENEFKRG